MAKNTQNIIQYLLIGITTVLSLYFIVFVFFTKNPDAVDVTDHFNIELQLDYRELLNIELDLNKSLFCRKYYLQHLQTFHGEEASTIFKYSLTSLLKRLHISRIFAVDVGANHGQFFDFDWIHNHTKVAHFLMIEPNPSLHNIIRDQFTKLRDTHNAAQCDCNLTVLQYALTSDYAAHDAKMIYRVNIYNSELSRLIDAAEYKKVYKTHKKAWKDSYVDIATLDYVLEEHAPTQQFEFKILKIDTEGFDVTVLYGTKASIHMFDAVLYECSIGQAIENQGPGTSHYGAALFFEKHSFSLYKLGSNHSLPLALQYYDPIYDRIVVMDWQNCVAINRKSMYYDQLVNLLNIL
eukprot:509359_1